MRKTPKTAPLPPEKIEKLRGETLAFLRKREQELKSIGDFSENALYVKYISALTGDFIGVTIINDHPKFQDSKYPKKIIVKPRLDGSSDYILKLVHECPYAYQATADTISKIIEKNLTLHEKLKPFATGILRGEIPPTKHGKRPKYGNWWRDFYINIAIYRLKKEGLPVIRQEAYGNLSAVSIVKEELEKIHIRLSHSAINTIWKNRLFPDG